MKELKNWIKENKNTIIEGVLITVNAVGFVILSCKVGELIGENRSLRDSVGRERALSNYLAHELGKRANR